MLLTAEEEVRSARMADGERGVGLQFRLPDGSICFGCVFTPATALDLARRLEAEAMRRER